MKSLRDAIGGWAPVTGAAADDPLVAIGAAWVEIVGADIAANSHPVEIDRDALVVATRSSAWSQQLAFLGERIVEAIRARAPQAAVARVRFRVGRMPSRGTTRPRPSAVRAQRLATEAKREQTASPPEAIARFRADVEAFWRAKRAAGWKECSQCGVPIAPRAGTSCVTCAGAQADERAGVVARLLYETPWLGYDGVARVVAGLSRDEYGRIRRRLLARWWDTLRRALRARRLSRDGRERLLASSYVLLKSGVDPERIVPATVRNLLGDELHDLIYGTDKTEKTNVQ
jgi:predicted nucleic acid-binding Zn ribbon protein